MPFLKWLIFGVILALLPIGFNLVYALTVFGLWPSAAFLFGRGELLLLAVGLSSSTLGNLMLGRHRWRTLRLVVAGVCAADIAFASFYFALISGKYVMRGSTDTGVEVTISLALYVVAVVSGGTSVVSAER